MKRYFDNINEAWAFYHEYDEKYNKKVDEPVIENGRWMVKVH